MDTILIQGRDLTEAEADRALRHLAETRDGLAQAIEGLAEAQWKFKPGPDRWSIAEVAEHLGMVEGLFLNNVVARLREAPGGGPDRDAHGEDARILAVMESDVKFQAPPHISPSGSWSREEALDRLLACRAKTVEFLNSTPDLRQHLVIHPVLGPIDGYQWVTLIASHTERHTNQIQRVKADSKYPSN